MTFQKHSLSLAAAQTAVAAAFEAARSAGPIAVTVSDENGDPVFMARLDGAPAADVRLAARKAYTAAFVGRDTRAYRDQIRTDGRTLADWADPMMTTLSGGLTVRANGSVVGGIGVSGAGDRDEEVARAALDAMGLS